MATDAVTRRFTVREYHRMAEAGILAEDDRVELLDGEVVEMEPISSRHAACVDRLNALFGRLGNAAVIRVQSPVRLDRHSEPEPDVALLRPDPDFYAVEHPGPDDALLVVEVAESSGGLDRDEKLPLYARAGVPEAWLVDLGEETIHVCSDPSGEGYRTSRRLGRDEEVAPEAFPDFRLRVREILG